MYKILQKSEMITHSGIVFDLINPVAKNISIYDIAHHLSQLCRWNGATRTFYSVAEHSVKVYELYASRVSMSNEFTRNGALACLLHDAEEAYWGDIIRPIKSLYPEIENKLLDLRCLISSHFGTSYITYMADIIKYDNIALQWEYDNIVSKSKVASSHPIMAERQFLGIFDSLYSVSK